MANETNNIQWWKEDALKRPAAESNNTPQEPIAQPQVASVNRTGNLLEPLIQPIVVVPYTQDMDYEDEDELLAEKQEELDIQYQNDRNKYMSVDNDNIYSPKKVLTRKEQEQQFALSQSNAGVLAAYPAGRKVYSKKRILFILIALILGLAIIAMIAIPFTKALNQVYPYISLLKKTEVNSETEEATTKYMMVGDPVIGLFELFGKPIESMPTDYVNMLPEAESRTTMDKIFGYVIPIAIGLYAIFDLLVVIFMIVALFKGKKNGVYKKVKIGFLTICMFIFAVALTIGCLLLNGGFGSFMPFLTGNGATGYFAGIGLFIMVGVPVLMFICTCLNYKRLKR